MNYRHAFHAGNFADVMKHALLVRMLLHLRRKEAPFRVIDTHAGIGFYDLAGPEAGRGGEWQGGIGRLDTALPDGAEALLAPYREILDAVRARHGPATYPGSPAIARELLRRDDRAILVEKHPADAATLTARFNTARNVKTLEMDGWTALRSLIPPKERRGLVLVDPPYEERGELAKAVAALARANRTWPTGMLALWYPVKGADEVGHAVSALTAEPPVPILRLELLLERPAASARLAGCGLLVVNPPWTLADEAATLLAALAGRLGREDPGFTVEAYEPARGRTAGAPPGGAAAASR